MLVFSRVVSLLLGMLVMARVRGRQGQLMVGLKAGRRQLLLLQLEQIVVLRPPSLQAAHPYCLRICSVLELVLLIVLLQLMILLRLLLILQRLLCQRMLVLLLLVRELKMLLLQLLLRRGCEKLRRRGCKGLRRRKWLLPIRRRSTPLLLLLLRCGEGGVVSSINTTYCSAVSRASRSCYSAALRVVVGRWEPLRTVRITNSSSSSSSSSSRRGHASPSPVCPAARRGGMPGGGCGRTVGGGQRRGTGSCSR